MLGLTSSCLYHRYVPPLFRYFSSIIVLGRLANRSSALAQLTTSAIGMTSNRYSTIVVLHSPIQPCWQASRELGVGAWPWKISLYMTGSTPRTSFCVMLSRTPNQNESEISKQITGTQHGSPPQHSGKARWHLPRAHQRRIDYTSNETKQLQVIINNRLHNHRRHRQLCTLHIRQKVLRLGLLSIGV